MPKLTAVNSELFFIYTFGAGSVMGTPRDDTKIVFTEDHEAMLEHTVKRVSKLEESSNLTENRVLLLEHFKLECDQLHKAGEEKQRRQEDATNRNTESTILLAKAVADINITITRLVQTDGDVKPIIELYNQADSVWTFNKKLWTCIIAVAAGVITLAGAWKVFEL